MKKAIAALLFFALLAPGAARAEGPVAFSDSEYDCLQALGKELYEDYSRPAIDALPPYLKQQLRAALDRQSCNDAGVMQIITRYIDDADAKYLAPLGISPQRVQILPRRLNNEIENVIHDPDIPESSKKSYIKGLMAKELPASFSILTDDDLVYLYLNMSNGEVLQRMPPNIIQKLHDLINDPKLKLHDAEKSQKVQMLLDDENLSPDDLAYLRSIGHDEDYLTNPNEVLPGVHFAIADTTVSADEKKRRIDALFEKENGRRQGRAATQRDEHIGIWLIFLFPLIAVGCVPATARLLTSPAGWEKWKPRLPFIVAVLVTLWALCLIVLIFPNLTGSFLH